QSQLIVYGDDAIGEREESIRCIVQPDLAQVSRDNRVVERRQSGFGRKAGELADPAGETGAVRYFLRLAFEIELMVIAVHPYLHLVDTGAAKDPMHRRARAPVVEQADTR